MFSLRMRLPTGLRGRLLLAFAAISSLAILAAVAGFVAFVVARRAVDEMTVRRMPETLGAMELVRRSDRLVATGPALLDAVSADEISAVVATKNAELKAIRRQISGLQGSDGESPMVREIDVTIENLKDNLDEITTAVMRRDEASSEKNALLRNAFGASQQFAKIWSVRFEELQKQVVELQRSTTARQTDPGKSLATINALDEAMQSVLPLDQLQRRAAESFQLLVGGAQTEDLAELARLKAASEKVMRDIDGLVSGVDLDVSTALLPAIKLLHESAIGPGGLFTVRETEVQATTESRQLIAQNVQLSNRLSAAVAAFVAISKRQMESAARGAYAVQNAGSVALAVIMVLSLAGSVLIVWLYVGRNIVSRLAGISAGMAALAAGRRDVVVNTDGVDEISEMGRAVDVFRHNAIERDTLLVERAEAADRLEHIVEERTLQMRQARDEAIAATRTTEAALTELQAAQAQLVQAEKMASLGQLTAGIAHEIKNPLNFVNNFASLSVELLSELKEIAAPAIGALAEDKRTEVDETIGLLTSNLEKIAEHGRRADGIVKSMLEHSRGSSGERRSADLNDLVEEALNLAYHGARAQDQNFNITLERDFGSGIAPIELVPQDVKRVFLNLFGNGFYAASKRQDEAGNGPFKPIMTVSTRDVGKAVEVRIRDNGIGIPLDIRDKLFLPFFTTKPTGEGTGLGLSISYDIVTQQHGGTIEVDSLVGEYTEFTIRLPRDRQAAMDMGVA
jgi:signal transduction histidine kinase